MPSYTFKDKNTGEEHTELMSWDNSLVYLNENPNLERCISSFEILYSPGTALSKTSDRWKDRLKEMKKKHRGSNINV